MTNEIIVRPRTVRVSSSTTGVVLDSSTPVTLKSTLGRFRLDALDDVNAAVETENATLVYQSNTDTYVVKQIDLDGGTF